MSAPRLLVTAKAPRPGHVKTRLCPPLGLALAARLGHAFLQDVLATASDVDPGAGLLAPADDTTALRRLFPDVTVIEQRGHGLAQALAGAVADGVTLVSGDAPAYPRELMRAGLDSPADIVLGPSLDGGYCLIGMRRFDPAPFRDIAWSTGAVLEQTVAAARRAGLSVELLEPAADVDTIDDLLAADLHTAPHTSALLADPELTPFLPRPRPAVTARRVLLESPWRTHLVDELDGGDEYSYLETPRAVWVVPVTDSGETVFVRQYRHPVRGHPLEMPAGSIDAGERAEEAAVRELREEVGGFARHMRRVGGFYSSSGHITLEGTVFLATGVALGAPTHPPSEGIELVRMPFARALALARAGELCEAQTALAVILAGQAL
jgi:glycosyltransferase A (GT-A) superfamily protein (DUF2064 family)/8-oxo-dGTP pyrophosphatase MutT (NUDIX family)